VRGGGISGARCVTYFQFIMLNSTSRAVTQSSSSILQQSEYLQELMNPKFVELLMQLVNYSSC
jgi:hypothetical protein